MYFVTGLKRLTVDVGLIEAFEVHKNLPKIDTGNIKKEFFFNYILQKKAGKRSVSNTTHFLWVKRFLLRPPSKCEFGALTQKVKTFMGSLCKDNTRKEKKLIPANCEEKTDNLLKNIMESSYYDKEGPLEAFMFVCFSQLYIRN